MILNCEKRRTRCPSALSFGRSLSRRMSLPDDDSSASRASKDDMPLVTEASTPLTRNG